MSLPPHLRADDPAAADPARRRLLRKSTLLRFSSPFSPSPNTSFPPPFPTDHLTDDIHIDLPPDDIHIDYPHLPHTPDDKDIYRWAILYENQRGITLFSTPFYSPLSLLPSDPQPFTIPHSHNSLPTLSLHDYPLPDGTWRWVSTAWMIDMRTDLPQVQHDGFEYNWHFRDNHWHAQIGKLGAGTWVRRRRWVRLMMRPSIHTHPHKFPSIADHPAISSSPTLPHPTSQSSSVELHHDVSHVWNGDEQDWQHVHRLLKHLGRDGRKLELWRTWLGPYAQTHPSDAPSPSSHLALEKRLSDVVPDGNSPPLVHLVPILRNHGEAILHSFVFPDSRAQFLELVRRAGLTEDLERCLGRAFSTTNVDFWSYADNLDKLLDKD